MAKKKKGAAAIDAARALPRDTKAERLARRDAIRQARRDSRK